MRKEVLKKREEDLKKREEDLNKREEELKKREAKEDRGTRERRLFLEAQSEIVNLQDIRIQKAQMKLREKTSNGY